MKGDFTRLTFDPNKHYSSVRMQQGRVQLDADWNEKVDIELHYNRQAAKDIVGACGAPDRNPGFALILASKELETAGLPEEELKRLSALLRDNRDFLISKGCYYVDGIYCENEDFVAYSGQPDYPLVDPPFENITDGYYLVYLKVWERHMTSVEDPDIQEAALGGVDTTTRTKIVWQVKLKGPFDSVENWDEVWRKAIPKRVSSIAARVKSFDASGDPCIITSADHTDLGNQLYRVEVHNAGKVGRATFKWSRDNGSSVWPIAEIAENVVTIKSCGKNLSNIFGPGQWVEIIDDVMELRGCPGVFSQVISVDHSDIILRPQRHEKEFEIEKIEKDKIIIGNPGESQLRFFAPGMSAEIDDKARKDPGKVALLVKIKSLRVDGEIVELIVEPKTNGGIEIGSIGDHFPLENKPIIAPYRQIGLEFLLRNRPKLCFWDSPAMQTSNFRDGVNIERIEKDTIIIKKPDEKILSTFSPGNLIELTDNDRERRGQIRTLARVESQKIDELTVELRLKSDNQDDLKGHSIGAAFPLQREPQVIPYDPEKRWIELEKGIEVCFGKGDNHYRNGDYWLIPSRSSKGGIEWPAEEGVPKYQQRFGIKHHYCRLAVMKYSSSGWSVAQDYHRNFAPLTELGSKPDIRLREAVNAVLKGNMPYDHQSNLLANKSYLEAFEDFSGRIWLFARYEKEIWFARYGAGLWEEKCLIHEASRSCTPVIIEDSRSDLWIFWCQNENIWFNKCSTNEWGKGIQLTEGNIQKSNLKAFDSKGCIWLFWQQEKGIWYNRCLSGKWVKEDKPLIEGPIEEDPEVVADSLNNIWIFWREKNQLWCMRCIDDKWHDRKMLSKGEPLKEHINLIEELHGDIWAFWLQANNIWLARHGSGGWNEPIQLTSTNEEKELSSVFKDSRNNIWIFWKKDNNIFCRNFSHDSGNWLDEVDLTAGPERKRFLAVTEDNSGAIWLFWWQSNKIFYKKFDSIKWSEKDELIGAPEETSFYPFNRKSGDIWVVLEKLNSVNFWCKRYVNGDWLPEIRLTSDPLKKEYLCNFEDLSSNQWLFWRRTDLGHLMCRRCFDII